VELPDSYIPQKDNNLIYMKHFEIFERLIIKLHDEFDSIAELQYTS